MLCLENDGMTDWGPIYTGQILNKTRTQYLGNLMKYKIYSTDNTA